jgi:hypothetical protein
MQLWVQCIIQAWRRQWFRLSALSAYHLIPTYGTGCSVVSEKKGKDGYSKMAAWQRDLMSD